jgi:hypothetical protein
MSRPIGGRLDHCPRLRRRGVDAHFHIFRKGFDKALETDAVMRNGLRTLIAVVHGNRHLDGQLEGLELHDRGLADLLRQDDFFGFQVGDGLPALSVAATTNSIVDGNWPCRG